MDLPRIERWIETSDEYEKVNAILKQTRLVQGSMGQPALNPLVRYLSVLLGELGAAETELGMTPLARQRLGIAYGQARLTARELNRFGERAKGPDTGALGGPVGRGVTPGLFTRLLHFLDSDRAKRRLARWKGIRNLIAYAIWFFRFRPRRPDV